MIPLNLDLGQYQTNLSIRHENERRKIFDPIRKKYIWLGPEEYVRQLIIQFLLKEKSISKNRIAVEKQFLFNTLKKRFDIVVYDDQINPNCIIECKAYSHAITQKDVDQIIIYNMYLNATYLLVSNGLNSYHWEMDSHTNKMIPKDSFNL